MPSTPFSWRLRRLTNGLTVVLLHDAELPQAAAFARIGAGSHQAPRAYPGLAHFLEHLFFLGSEGFTPDDGLMPLVQRLGGELNAHTAAVTTDFFFALAPAHLEAGLVRLLDMLAAPLLDPAAQRREREVLHAEFIAWARSADTRRDRALAVGLPADHPAGGFHAGNRYSLPLQAPAFQAALRAFHQDHYRASNALLVLAGPQSLDDLSRLAGRHGARLPAGRAPVVPAPAPLERNGETWQHAPEQPPRLALQFRLDALPPAAWEAAALLESLLLAEHPGSLIDALRHQDLAERLSLTWPYRQASQGLLRLDLTPTAAGADPQAATLVTERFAFLRTQPLAVLQDRHAVRLGRQWATLPALALVRQLGERLWQAPDRLAAFSPALSPAAQAAWPVLLAQLDRQHLSGFLAGPQATRPPVVPPTWRLPQVNPLLDHPARTAPTQGSAWPATVALAPGHREGLLHLRWHWPGAAPRPPSAAAFAALAAEAVEAGVALRWSPSGAPWELRLHGWSAALAATLAAFCARLVAVDANAGEAPASEPLLIRQLLKVLPERVMGQPSPHGAPDWATACWQGLACGLPEAILATLPAVPVPGRGQAPLPPPAPLRERRWLREPSSDPQGALLMFCPQPDLAPATEAAWRLLGARLQAPFFRRLRSERQLGYAVFSGYRLVGDRRGLLFGIQSPQLSSAALYGEIQAFLHACWPDITDDPATLVRAAAALAQDLGPTTPQRAALAERLWQGYRESGALELTSVHTALAALTPTSLEKAWRQLLDSSAECIVLANGPAPDNFPT